jgi:four helix bundle protein
VWQASHNLVLEIYNVLKKFPPEERFTLCDQIKRAAYSVPANIVEGHSKNSKKEFIKYLYISRGSLEELRYFLLLSFHLNYISEECYNNMENNCIYISKMLNGLLKSLQ